MSRLTTLLTERLLLRHWRDDDLDDYAAMAADEEVMRFIGGTVDRDTAWRQMAIYSGHWQLRGHGQWVVERREDGALLGRAGLWYPEGWFGLEVGWALARSAWGNGYATEAARAAVDWAVSERKATELISVIAMANAPSIRVAERLGMAELGDTEHNGVPITIYGLSR